MNAERCLLAGEALGLGYVALEKASKYAKERVVFGRPIGQNQGVAHPLADAYMNLEAAKLATYHAAKLYDASSKDKTITQHAVGVACNTAKYLAAEAAFTACERSVRESTIVSSGTLVLTRTRYLPTVVWATLKSIMSSAI
jgi:acyl-CoA dehydrogenase